MCPLKTLTEGGKCSTLASKTGLNTHEKKGRVIMKRLIGILLVVLAVFCFVACDSDNPSPSGSSSMPDENVMTQYSNVMSDAQFLINLRSNPDRTEQEEVIASKFDMPLEEDTIRLKEGGLMPNIMMEQAIIPSILRAQEQVKELYRHQLNLMESAITSKILWVQTDIHQTNC